MTLREFVGRLEWGHLWIIPFLIGMAVISIVASFLSAVITGFYILARGVAFVLGVKVH
jgi:hypothetical protein